MNTLTKEHFDEQLKKLATKEDLKQQTEELATIVNDSFQDHQNAVDKKLDDIKNTVKLTHEIVEKSHEARIKELEFQVREIQEMQKVN